MKTRTRNLLITFTGGLLLFLGFNNCSGGFQVQDPSVPVDLSSSANNPPDSNNPPPANPPSNPVDTNPMPSQFSAQSLHVCANGCPYTLPSQALAAAKDGDLIEILSGDYVDCLSVQINQITVRGVGPTRPHLHSKICDGKGIITNYGRSNRFENMELSDFANSDLNAAAVRQDAAARDVILSNLFIHNGQMGVLGGNTGDRIRINQSEFKDVGYLRPDGEISVPVFMTAGASLQIRASRFTDSIGGASFIKARSEELIIDCSTIANLDSEDSYNIDYQTGGKFSLFNSVIEQSASTQNFTMVALNSVNFNPAIANTMTLKGNIFLNDAGRGTMVNIYRDLPSSLQIAGNYFIGGGTVLSQGGPVDNTNVILTTRPTSYGAYPALPSPGSCMTSAPFF